MIYILLVFMILLVLLLVATCLLGFRLGGEHWQSELAKVRLEAAQAERRMHDMTRDAFVAMTEAAQRRQEK